MKKMSATFFFAFVVLTWASPTLPAQTLPQDQGAAGFYLKLRKLQTIASAMHTTAHPDDEHGGTLAMLSRGQGVRLALLTLNRGESGANAIGAELFEALGLIRTEELLVANRYYGVDNQYFTSVVDYGFSKRLDEALDKWGHENVLRDVVAIIRTNRPLVLISRFQGNQRDGHGHHQLAGLITQEAFKAAADPDTFPEQLAAGLRPWQALKLYAGGTRADEPWHLRIDTGQYDPVLGDSYHTLARLGLSFQRSQNSGRMTGQPGPALAYYKRLASLVDPPAQEQSFFDGIDTKVPGMYRALQHPAPPQAAALLEAIANAVQSALQAFSIGEPSASVPALTRGLQATRTALQQLGADLDVAFMLQIKEQQFMDAINAGLGMHFTAMAQPQGVPEALGPFAAVASVPTMGPVVPGQTFEVRASLTDRSPLPVVLRDIRLLAQPGWSIQGSAGVVGPMPLNQPVTAQFVITVPANAAVTRPYYRRDSVVATRYTVDDPGQQYRPAATPVLPALARYEVAGVPVELREIVRRREAHLPYGHRDPELAVVPALALNVTPANTIVPLSKAPKTVHIQVELLNNRDGDVAGTVQLQLPAGWTSQPPAYQFQCTRANEKRHFDFTVAMSSLTAHAYTIEAIASAAGREWREGYDIITHRDLETRYLYHPARSQVRGVDVTVASGLKVGYIMGVGDEVPAAIAQLGATVELLGEQDLATGDLRQFDAIMTGTRAYAVREDLKTYNQRLLDYVHAGGNLIVLYNTQEFIPTKYAPFPADLPARAEEVAEEDSPVDILAPDHRMLQSPNKITKADFEGWIEQRGSKFFSTWDPAYTPMIATHDQGQAPQQGGWLLARYGQGYYTYFAYALHRQLPYGVAGAYRLLANLLSLGK